MERGLLSPRPFERAHNSTVLILCLVKTSRKSNRHSFRRSGRQDVIKQLPS